MSRRLTIEAEISETKTYVYVSLKIREGETWRTSCVPFLKKTLSQGGWDEALVVSKAVLIFMKEIDRVPEPLHDPETEELIK